MPLAPDIRVVKVEYGPLPGAASLNPRLSPGRPLLRATLDIAWDPPDPASAIATLEESLLRFSPAFASHQCRGLARYHVFSRAPGRGGRAAGAGSAEASRAPAQSSNSFEGPLALAHLIEHAILDFQCAAAGDCRTSGVTAALHSPGGRFDVLVECGDPAIGRCCLALAVTWLTCALAGHAPGEAEREVLAAARVAHDGREEKLSPPQVARTLAWSESRARRALAALSEAGYLAEIPWTMNLSGAAEYRVAPVTAGSLTSR